MSAQIRLAIGARVMHIHAVVDATRNETAAQDTSEQGNEEAGQVGDDAGLSACLSVHFGSTIWTHQMCGLPANGHHCRHNDCGAGLCGRQWTDWLDAADRLSVAGWR